MSEIMDTVLVEALDLLDQGLSVDEVVARYPNSAAELRPFLLTAAALSKMATLPSVVAKQDSRRAFLAAAGEAATRPAPMARRSVPWLTRLAGLALALLAVIFIGGAGLVGASASAVPGDALYATKRFVEETQLRLASDPEQAAALRQRFEQERVNEVGRLLAEGRAADVRFTGTIESLSGDRWMVSGLPVDVAAATIDGAPGVGAQVEVVGRADAGVVAAGQIMILKAGPPERIDEAPPPVETPRPSSTPRPTRDNSNSNDAGGYEEHDDSDNDNSAPGAPGAAPTVMLTATLPAPTPVSPTPLPPPGDDNGNDNDDGNDNDNVNDNDDVNDNDGNDNDGVNDNDDINDNDDGGNSGPGGGSGDDNTNDNDSPPPDDDNSNDNDAGDDDNSNDNDAGDDDNSNDDGGDSGNDNGDDDDNDNGG